MSFFHHYLSSPVGNLLLLASEHGLRALLWEKEGVERIRAVPSVANQHHPILQQTAHELDEYFTKKRERFTVQLDLIGSDFQRRAWHALQTIPYGETRSYAQQALMMDSAKAVRAVGVANSKNPIAIVVPCHRVIGSNGRLTGFSGGLAAKQKLLDIEGVVSTQTSGA